MGLQSKLLKGDSALEACLVQDSAHVVPGASGEHVRKIQTALAITNDASIDPGELSAKRYGPSTAGAVLAFKRKRNIVNRNYQTQADNIVGKMTIAALDKEVLAKDDPERRGRVLVQGMTGEDVVTLQRLLNHHLSPSYPRLDPDGTFGPQTHARVLEFQRLNRDYPVKMPVPGDAEKKPLKIDGVVGDETLKVLLDFRSISTPGSRMEPTDRSSAAARPVVVSQPAALVGAPVGDPPKPTTLRIVTVQSGQQAQFAPWFVSPVVLTLQFTLLAKNAGRPDFLLTAGGQAALNSDPKVGRWTGQGFLQMGLGGFPKLAGGRLDLFNPFVQLMLQKNEGHPPSIGGAIGNQSSYSLVRRRVGNDPDPQDVLSVFVNLQAVAMVGLDNGICDVPRTQGTVGVSFSAF